MRFPFLLISAAFVLAQTGKRLRSTTPRKKRRQTGRNAQGGKATLKRGGKVSNRAGKKESIQGIGRDDIADTAPAMVTDAPTNIPGFLAPEKAFNFTIKCTGMPEPDCNKAKAILKRAGARIGSALLFRKPVSVNATFRSFCGDEDVSTCAMADRIGQATPSSKYAGHLNDGPLVMYPQAILRQCDVNTAVDYNDFDIFSEFNSQFPFYLGEEGGEIPKDQVDLEFIAVHELTHGLGLLSGLINYKNELDRPTEYLAPAVVVTSDKSAYFSPLNAYDNLIFGDTTSFKSLGKVLSSFKKAKLSKLEYLKAMEADPTMLKAATELLKITTGDLTVQPSKGSSMSLYSPPKFERGSSLSHGDKTQGKTPDFCISLLISNGSVDCKRFKFKSELETSQHDNCIWTEHFENSSSHRVFDCIEY